MLPQETLAEALLESPGGCPVKYKEYRRTPASPKAFQPSLHKPQIQDRHRHPNNSFRIPGNISAKEKPRIESGACRETGNILKRLNVE
jgi:hypothetical protein